MSQIVKFVDVNQIGDFENVRKQLETRWLELETIPNVFRYKLNIQKQKVITNGPFPILVQVSSFEQQKVGVLARMKWMI